MSLRAKGLLKIIKERCPGTNCRCCRACYYLEKIKEEEYIKCQKE
jgi:hypothetical protein